MVDDWWLMIEYPQVFDPRLPMCHPSGVDSDGFEEKLTMARITPIDVIKGISMCCLQAIGDDYPIILLITNKRAETTNNVR